jgi:hypothetical protein
MLIPFNVGARAGGAAAQFIGISALQSASVALPLPGGAAAGDFCVLVGCGNSAVSCSGFTAVTGDIVNASPSTTSFAWKVLSAGDISSPPTVTVPSIGGFYSVVYRGPTTSLTKKSTNTSTGSTVSVSGFTKAAGSKFIIACSHDRDATGALAAPSGFNNRASGTTTFFSHGVYDLASSAYGGGSVTCNLHAVSFAGRGTLLELI